MGEWWGAGSCKRGKENGMVSGVRVAARGRGRDDRRRGSRSSRGGSSSLELEDNILISSPPKVVLEKKGRGIRG